MTKQSSSVALILANLFPLAGVLLHQWDVLSLLLLYWAESVIVGVMNIFRIICTQTDDMLAGMDKLMGGSVPALPFNWRPKIPMNLLKVFLVPFFIFHYGAFCYAHLSILLSLFTDDVKPMSIASSNLDPWQPAFWIAVAAVFCSHWYSFFRNYIGRGEYKWASMPTLIFRPYARIAVMHAVVIFGAVLLTWFQSPMMMLLLLIALKIFIDLRLHQKDWSKISVPQFMQA